MKYKANRRFLTYKDREYIERELRKGTPIVKIAERLNMHRTTIYKEIRRSGETKETYTALKGQMAL